MFDIYKVVSNENGKSSSFSPKMVHIGSFSDLSEAKEECRVLNDLAIGNDSYIII